MAIITPHSLAATYHTTGDLTPWQRVQEYRRVSDYSSEHQNKGSQAVATALDLPRSRIRPWVDNDSKPDPVHAIDTARELGWLDVDPNSQHGHAWTRLVAWIYAGGSIATTDYQPTFYAREDTQQGGLSMPEVDVLAQALQTIGLKHQFVNRTDVYDGGQQSIGKRATEIIPTEHRTLLGRCLAAADAPVGEKNTTHPSSLPNWLQESSIEGRRVFARIYLLTRAAIREHEPRFVIREQRPDSYHEELVDLLKQVAGDDTITRSGHNIYIRSEGADTILSE
jgi:hypothetical protein